jgi:hypothetical protein
LASPSSPSARFQRLFFVTFLLALKESKEEDLDEIAGLSGKM